MYIASIAEDVKLHLWPSGQLINTYKANSNGIIRSISWGKDGKWLVVVPYQGPAEIIGLRDNILKHLSSLDNIQQPTCAVFQNLTKRNIAFGTSSGNVLIYDVKHKSIRKYLPRANSTIFRLEYSVNDNYLFAGCIDGAILPYNNSTMNCSGSYRIPNTKTLTTIRTHPTRKNLLMAGCEEGLVAVWDFYRTSLIHKNQAHQAVVTDVSFSPRRDDLIVSCGLDRKFVFWDVTSNSLVLQQILDRSPTSIDFCPDGIGLAVGTQAGTILTYDTRQMNNPTYVFKAHNSFVKQILFQKDLIGDESCDYGVVQSNQEGGDGLKVQIGEEEPPGEGCESFGSILYDNVYENDDKESNNDNESEIDHQQDSFLAALGISQSSFKDSQGGPISKGVRKLLDSKPNLFESGGEESPGYSKNKSSFIRDVSPNSSKPGAGDHNPKINLNTPTQTYRKSDKISFQHQSSENLDEPPLSDIRGQHLETPAVSLKHRQLSRIIPGGEKRKSTGRNESQSNISPMQRNSTPKLQCDSIGETPGMVHISPIVCQPSKPSSDINMDKIHEMVKEVVKQEVKDQLEVFHQSLRYDIMEALTQMRRHFLDIQMSIVKESVLLENNINKIREELRKED